MLPVLISIASTMCKLFIYIYRFTVFKPLLNHTVQLLRRECGNNVTDILELKITIDFNSCKAMVSPSYYAYLFSVMFL